MKTTYFPRLLKKPDHSFFLFGPRGTGKSTWLRRIMPDAIYFDLLDTALYLQLARNPNELEAMVGKKPPGAWVVIDEIQKIPLLLDEVHRLMELRGWQFVLCGSSARKLRRQGVNLLAGRALTLDMEAFSWAELGRAFDLDFALEWGSLPFVQLNRPHAAEILNAYISTYIKEEIREEGIVRKVHPFLRFLSITGQLNSQMVNGQNIAREAAVPRSSVDVYFSVLIDTLLGHFLPAYRPRLKVREMTHPKFYWFDPGVARAAAGLLHDPLDRVWRGGALETLIFHELRIFNEVSGKHRSIAYYRTAAGVEVDFIVETRKPRNSSPARIVCIEVKSAKKWNRAWEKPMRSLHALHGIRVERMIGVYTGTRTYHYDGVDVLPVTEFLSQLHEGDIF